MTPSEYRPSHERLRVWRSALDLVKVVYRDTAGWPADERYGLTRQVRRAAVSVVANLAEGSARTGPRQMRVFSQIAHGSVREVQALFTVGHELGFVDKECMTRLEAALFPVARQLLRLLQSLSAA